MTPPSRLKCEPSFGHGQLSPRGGLSDNAPPREDTPFGPPWDRIGCVVLRALCVPFFHWDFKRNDCRLTPIKSRNFTEPTAASAVQALRGTGHTLGGERMIGDREELLRLAYIKLMDAVELLQSIGEDLLADEAEAVAAKVGRAALAAAPT